MYEAQALVSFKKYMPPPLPYFKVNIYPFPLPLNIFRLFVILSLTQTGPEVVVSVSMT
jgi:hypothetical protein